MKHFSPHLEILPPSQRTLWEELREVSREFVLYGGTALALHLGHRNSAVFDFFGSRTLDLSQIEQGISFLKGANIIQRDKNTLSAIVDRGGPVKVSFFGVPNLPRLSAAVRTRKEVTITFGGLPFERTAIVSRVVPRCVPRPHLNPTEVEAERQIQ